MNHEKVVLSVEQLASAQQGLPPLRIPFRSRLAISERRLLLASGDLFLISSSIVGSLLLWSRRADRSLHIALWQEQALWAVFICVGWVLWLILNNLYDLRMAVRVRRVTRITLTGGLTIGIAYLFLFFLVSPTPVSSGFPFFGLAPSGQLLRLAPALAIASSTALLLAWRLLYALVLGTVHARRRVLILGAGQAGSTICQLLHEHADHYNVLGFVDDHPDKQETLIHDIKVLGSHIKLVDLVEKQGTDEIVVAISADVRGSLFQAIMDCHERGITITPMPLLYERLTGKISVEHVGSQWYAALPLHQHPAAKLFQLFKRLLDILLGLIAGTLLLLVFPFVALAIKLDSPGPVFYTQLRAGLHGRTFLVRKFRSMVQDAERDGRPRWAQSNDDRVTRVGKFLRKSRLDELPQIVNVLKGEMSLVGPRPERPQFVNQLQYKIPFYRTRLAVKPGMTGWAQVKYGYGSTAEDALIKLQYDLYYIKHQSPWLDLLIMLRTFGVILRMKGQ